VLVVDCAVEDEIVSVEDETEVDPDVEADPLVDRLLEVDCVEEDETWLVELERGLLVVVDGVVVSVVIVLLADDCIEVEGVVAAVVVSVVEKTDVMLVELLIATLELELSDEVKDETVVDMITVVEGPAVVVAKLVYPVVDEEGTITVVEVVINELPEGLDVVINVLLELALLVEDFVLELVREPCPFDVVVHVVTCH
jgi:hypothetical protein